MPPVNITFNVRMLLAETESVAVCIKSRAVCINLHFMPSVNITFNVRILLRMSASVNLKNPVTVHTTFNKEFTGVIPRR